MPPATLAIAVSETRRRALQGTRTSLALNLVAFNDRGVLLLLVWNVIPEMWTKPFAVGPVPVPFLLTLLLSCGLLFETTFYRRRLSLVNLAVIGVVLYAVARGLIASDRNHWDLKFFVVDLWSLQSLLLGLQWASRRSLPYIAYRLRSLAPIFLVVTVFTCLGLLAGFIFPINGEYSNRIYTGSLWCLATIAFLVWPFLHYAIRDWNSPRPYRFPNWSFGSANAAVVLWCGIFVSIFTATRNLFLVSVVVFFVGRCVEKRQGFLQTLKTLPMLAAAAAAIIVPASLVKVKGTSVIDRLSSTTILREQRWEEVARMFHQLGPDVLAGWGAGSMFYSPVMYDRNPLADSPHIGIVVGLLKGGFLMEGLLVVFPLFLCVRGLVQRTATSAAGAICVMGYLTLACFSGGWFAYQLFLYGVGIGLLNKNAEITGDSRLRF